MKLDLSRLNWPQAAVLCVLIAGIVCALVFTPPSVLARIPWPALLGGAAVGGGGVLASFLGRLFPPPAERSTPPTTPAAAARARAIRAAPHP